MLSSRWQDRHLIGGSCRSQIGSMHGNSLGHHSRAAVDGKMLEKFATTRAATKTQ